jgi:hypothetical protein
MSSPLNVTEMRYDPALPGTYVTFATPVAPVPVALKTSVSGPLEEYWKLVMLDGWPIASMEWTVNQVSVKDVMFTVTLTPGPPA